MLSSSAIPLLFAALSFGCNASPSKERIHIDIDIQVNSDTPTNQDANPVPISFAPSEQEATEIVIADKYVTICSLGNPQLTPICCNELSGKIDKSSKKCFIENSIDAVKPKWEACAKNKAYGASWECKFTIVK